jgi:hypothetical protein
MRSVFIFGLVVFSLSFSALGAAAEPTKAALKVKEVVWVPGMNVEMFWLNYAESKGGLTWAESTAYPEYEKVNEGDTFLIRLDKGPCLMEFFHSRWRRANDVKRWDDSINRYGGCPYVFN